MNFKPIDDPRNKRVLKKSGGEEILTVKPNVLYDFLSRQGYIINVFESNYLSYCDDGAGYQFGKCIRYRLQRLAYTGPIDILFTLMHKVGILSVYNYIAEIIGFQKGVQADPSPLSTLIPFNQFIDLLGEGKPGNAYFIHLLIPHRAFILDEKCSYKKGWKYFDNNEENKISASGKSSDIYSRYLKQIECAHFLMDKLIGKLNSNPETQNSTIVIHGDHGSRLSPLSPHLNNSGNFSDEDFIQNFSTFFSIRSPDLSLGYDRRPLALDELLSTLVSGETSFPNSKNEKFVYFVDSDNRIYRRFTFPPFANGTEVQTW